MIVLASIAFMKVPHSIFSYVSSMMYKMIWYISSSWDRDILIYCIYRKCSVEIKPPSGESEFETL